MEKAKDFSREKFDEIIDGVMRKYSKFKDLKDDAVDDFKTEMRRRWEEIREEEDDEDWNRLSDRISALDYANEKQHDGRHQKHVDKPTESVSGDKTKSPQYQKYDSYCDEHNNLINTN